MLEAYVVDYAKKRAKRQGFLHRKIVYAGRRGAPDDWFFGAGGRLIIIEFKKPKSWRGQAGKKTKNQVREIDRLKALGFEVHTVWTIEQVDEIFWRDSSDVI